MNSYLLELKKVVDQLAIVGALISTEEYIKVILYGLLAYYNPLITSIISHVDPYSIDEMEVLLLAIQECIEKTHNSNLLSSNFN